MNVHGAKLSNNLEKTNRNVISSSKSKMQIELHLGGICISIQRIYRANSRLARSQWETSIQSNAVSHWLGASLESSLSLLTQQIVVHGLVVFVELSWFSIDISNPVSVFSDTLILNVNININTDANRRKTHLHAKRKVKQTYIQIVWRERI